MILAQAIQLFNAEADVVEDPFEEAFLEGPTGMNGDSHAAVINSSFECSVAPTPVNFFKPQVF